MTPSAVDRARARRRVLLERRLVLAARRTERQPPPAPHVPEQALPDERHR